MRHLVLHKYFFAILFFLLIGVGITVYLSQRSTDFRQRAQTAGRQFYVDSIQGSDTNNGTSPSTPWKSLAKVQNYSLVAGDSNGDDSIDILDYNIIADCQAGIGPARNCTDPQKKQSADLTDDGKVDSFDYNLFLIELIGRRAG